MRDDARQMIEKMDENRKEIEAFIERLQIILDRGNRPAASLVDEWGTAQSKTVQLLPEVLALTDVLAADIENVSDEDIQGLMNSQALFKAAQLRQGDVILRSKKALGLIP